MTSMNFFPASVFPATYNFQSFKSRIHRHPHLRPTLETSSSFSSFHYSRVNPPSLYNSSQQQNHYKKKKKKFTFFEIIFLILKFHSKFSRTILFGIQIEILILHFLVPLKKLLENTKINKYINK